MRARRQIPGAERRYPDFVSLALIFSSSHAVVSGGRARNTLPEWRDTGAHVSHKSGPQRTRRRPLFPQSPSEFATLLFSSSTKQRTEPAAAILSQISRLLSLQIGSRRTRA